MFDDLALSRLLLVLLLIPLLGGLGLALVPRGLDKFTRSSAAFLALVNLAVSLLIAWGFNWDNPDIQLYRNIAWVPGLALTISYGVDAISLWLILLTTLVSFIAIASGSVKHRVKEFYVWLLLLEAAMIGAFLARDLIFFYVCFEFTLLPIYFLLGIHGGKDRLRAARLFFVYTFAGSLLTFAGILYVAWQNWIFTGAWSFGFAQLTQTAQLLSPTQQMWVLLSMLAGFAVKVPLFPLHTWQPLTYSQSPTASSMLLAGVLLKLSTYAMIRLAIPFSPLAAVELAPLIGVLAVIGILYAALICWVQVDLKKLIAYSSMSHMGFCILGMFALNITGLTGSVAYMVNHGLSTAALFLCVGIVQQRTGSRKITELGGLAKIMPVWATFLVLFVFSSVGLPGLNGFVGEFLTLLGAFTQPHLLGPWYTAFAGLGIILSAIYLLYMTGRLAFGPLRLPDGQSDTPAVAPASVRDLNKREIALLAPLALCCIWLGLYPQPLLRTLELPLTPIATLAQSAMQRTGHAPAAAASRTGQGVTPAQRAQHIDDPAFQAGSTRAADNHFDVTPGKDTSPSRATGDAPKGNRQNEPGSERDK